MKNEIDLTQVQVISTQRKALVITTSQFQTMTWSIYQMKMIRNSKGMSSVETTERIELMIPIEQLGAFGFSTKLAYYQKNVLKL